MLDYNMSFVSSSTSNSLPSPPRSPEENDDPGPYHIGQSFLIKRHIPTVPSGRRYRDSDVAACVVPTDVSQLDWCLKHPPHSGTTELSDTLSITIKASIRTGNHCGAHIVLIDDGLCAKIFDPLYYSFDNDLWHGEKVNVTTEADHDYTIEANAYIALCGSNLQGNVMPTYHGSWTTEVCTNADGQQHAREVRLILLEHITGTAMVDIDPDELDQEAKENIMYRVIEADTDLTLAGLQHDDFEPRNIILSSSFSKTDSTSSATRNLAFTDPNLRVCIIDYARSYVHKLAHGECSRYACTYRTYSMLEYQNPLFFWAGTDLWSQYGWLPHWEEATDWMWQNWGNGGRDKKYMTVYRAMIDKMGRPTFLQA